MLKSVLSNFHAFIYEYNQNTFSRPFTYTFWVPCTSQRYCVAYCSDQYHPGWPWILSCPYYWSLVILLYSWYLTPQTSWSLVGEGYLWPFHYEDLYHTIHAVLYYQITIYSTSSPLVLTNKTSSFSLFLLTPHYLKRRFCLWYDPQHNLEESSPYCSTRLLL